MLTQSCMLTGLPPCLTSQKLSTARPEANLPGDSKSSHVKSDLTAYNIQKVTLFYFVLLNLVYPVAISYNI